MIKVKENVVELKGTDCELLTELTIITKGLKEALEKNFITCKEVEHLIKEAVNLAFMDKSEIIEKSVHLHRDVMKQFDEMMERMFK